MYAYLFEHPKSEARHNALSIGGNRVAFFIDPVLEHTELTQSACGQHWAVTFFKGSTFELTLGVRLTRETLDTCPPTLARAIWLDNQDNSENNTQLLEQASRFIRKSTTLEAERIIALTRNRALLSDRDALAYFSSSEEQFRRLVLELCLAVAYRQVLQRSMMRLTESVKGKLPDQTLALYEDILHFNASDYFRYPVRLENHELFPAWDWLTEHHRLPVFNTELTSQLGSVALLLQEQREKARDKQEQEEREARRAAEQAQALQEQKMEKAYSRRSTWLGIALAGLSLLSLVELTPQHFKDAYSNWIVPYTSFITAQANDSNE